MDKSVLNVFKIGGKTIDDPSALANLLQRFAQISGPKILIHGGGQKAGQVSRQLGLEPQMIEGRRVTDEATLEIVTMVYAGLLNKKIISHLQAHSCNALGLTGADLNVVLAQKRVVKTIDYGFAGDVKNVNSQMIDQLLKMNVVPVFNAITHNGEGQLLNTNADTMAARIAAAMIQHYEVRLFYCFEQKGVLRDFSNKEDFYPEIDRQDFERFKANGNIAGGMIPKLQNAFYALEHQVAKVCIGAAKELNYFPVFKGTQICL